MSLTTSPPAPAPGPVLTPASVRTASLTAGISLALMAVLAPIGVMFALPAGMAGLAAIIVLVVATLDVVVAVALGLVLMPAGPLLAGLSAALRITYAAVFAVAAASLSAPADVARFEAVWNAGLLVFGVHLLVTGLALWRGGMPKWIAVLVAIAGLGYVADTVLQLTTSPAFSLSAFAFVGEVILLVWLIGWSGRKPLVRGV